MYKLNEIKSLLEGKQVLIAGYGREGRSFETFVNTYLPHTKYTIADGNEDIFIKSKEQGYDLIIKSPGVPLWVIDPKSLSKTTSLTDIFLQVYGSQTIGITGTKGKSTTTSLIHHLLPNSILAGNIGIPLFDILPQMEKESVVVAELSCHQLQIVHASPHIALILNLFEEHLDHYNNYADYQNAKLNIAIHQQSTDHFFYCTDNPDLMQRVENMAFNSHLHPYSLQMATAEEISAIQTLPLAGEHNRSNALVALRIAELVREEKGLKNQYQPPLKEFVGLKHRLQYVGNKRDRRWYNDSISTIPQATIAALSALPHTTALILGGMDRGIDYMPLCEYLMAHPVENIAFVGEAGRRMKHLFEDKVQIKRVLVSDNYEEIVQWCATNSKEGSSVLLSPAAASYDMFRNFEHRGEVFVDLINNL